MEDVSRLQPVFSASMWLRRPLNAPPRLGRCSCRVANYVSSRNGRTTLSGLGDLVRGLGGGSFDTIGVKGKGQCKRARLTNHRETIDLEAVCGGKLTMSREVCLGGGRHS
jgi:hypothetical protein